MKTTDEKKPQPLHPNQIVRLKEGPKYFGLRHSQLDESIKAGLIPRPFALHEGSRAKGWTGAQILEHQAKRLAQVSAVADYK